MTISSVDPAGVTETATPAEPSAKPATEPLLEHEYDGIREYDNPMPRWWVNVFWASFVFALGYFVHYQLSGNGQSVHEAYEEDMALAREERAKESLAEAPSEASLGKLMADGQLMLDAKATFTQRCVACHASEGQGLIGPNLTDLRFIHGQGKLMDIYAVVNDGVAAKGMPAWGLQLSPIEIRKLTAYVATIQGKNLPGKAPEGQPFER